MMAEEINLLDLIALSRITPDLVVEKFGSKINSSFFDASNILGNLRIKGLIDFTANFPGQSAITITEAGKQLLGDAEQKGKEPFDPVDYAILLQLKAGKRSYIDIGSAVNLRPRDLAMHIYKLGQQQYSVYEIRNGSVDVMLTEKGLMQANSGMPTQGGQAAPKAAQGQAPAGQMMQQPQPAQPETQEEAPVQQPDQAVTATQPYQSAVAQQGVGATAAGSQTGDDESTLSDLQGKMKPANAGKKWMIVLVIIVIVVIVGALFYLHKI